MERVKGIEPSSSAWKAVALPLSYTRLLKPGSGMQASDFFPSISDPCSLPSVHRRVVGEVGLEPTKAQPADLQSAPFAARDTPPFRCASCSAKKRPFGRTRLWETPRAGGQTRRHAGKAISP